jgi:DNA-binding NtrC family response regulator
MAGTGLIEGKRILIVDDEQDILDVLAEILKVCRISKASSFEEARDLMETQEFDLAVLDIMGVRGYDLLKIAQEKKIPAVMLTAHAFTPDNLVRSIREGAAFYIPKDELGRIAEFLNDVLEARAKGRNPWAAWQEKLPSSYFEKRFGAAWQDADKDFWATFRSSLQAGKPT